jgi:thiaminase (transcriptional activator TenA)
MSTIERRLSNPPAKTASPGLSERLRQSVLSLWQRQLQHPFVVALGNGSLPHTHFQFYICQDALFLDVLTKTFAYATTRTSDHDEMEQLGNYLLHTLLVEAELHRRYGARFGLTPAQMAAIPLAPTNYADWLATYASPDFDAVGVWIRERLDTPTVNSSPGEQARLQELFRISTCYEWLFWEMAWRLEEWPS